MADDGVRARIVILPWWALTVFFLALTVLTFHAARGFAAERRRMRGQCPACGYDLRRSPARCPECGRANDAAAPQRRRHAIPMAGVATAAMGISVVALCWWSDPACGAPSGKGTDPARGITFYPPWIGASGAADDRMFHRDASWGEHWRQAIWHRSDGDFLVILQGPGMSMFWEFWSVTVLDRSFHVVRQGSVGMEQGKPPWRLAEIHVPTGGAIHATGGKWCLCVSWKQKIQPVSPNDAEVSPTAAQPEFPLDATNPVQWNDDPPINNFTSFKEASDQVRSAEPAPENTDGLTGKGIPGR